MSDLELSLANLRARQEANAQKSLLQQLQLPLWAETQRGVPNSLLAELQATALVSCHKSNVGLRWSSKRIGALHRLPIRSVLAARCALRCAPMAARSLRHLIRGATLATTDAIFFFAQRRRIGAFGGRPEQAVGGRGRDSGS